MEEDEPGCLEFTVPFDVRLIEGRWVLSRMKEFTAKEQSKR